MVRGKVTVLTLIEDANIQKAPTRGAFCMLEPLIGIEPMTSSLPWMRSTD